MGKWIDRAVGLILLSLLLYLLFLYAFENIALSCLLSFSCCGLLLLHIWKKRPVTARMSVSQAEALLMQWACGPEEEARAQIARLTGLCGSSETLIYVPKHPAATLSISDLFSIWREHRDASCITIATLCQTDARACSLAKSLLSPTVEIIDAARLIPLIRTSNLSAPQTPRFRHWSAKLSAAIAALPGRKSWQRNALFGLMLMLLYLMGGNPAYLLLSIGTLFLAGIGLKQHHRA